MHYIKELQKLKKLKISQEQFKKIGLISGILIVGGWDGGYMSSVEVFNPSTGITCSVGDLPVARNSASLCNRMVCGGYPESGYVHLKNSIYDKNNDCCLNYL